MLIFVPKALLSKSAEKSVPKDRVAITDAPLPGVVSEVAKMFCAKLPVATLGQVVVGGRDLGRGPGCKQE